MTRKSYNYTCSIIIFALLIALSGCGGSDEEKTTDTDAETIVNLDPAPEPESEPTPEPLTTLDTTQEEDLLLEDASVQVEPEPIKDSEAVEEFDPTLDSDSQIAMYSWNEYMGGHYRERDWSRSIRDPSGPAKGGFIASDALIEVVNSDGLITTKDLDDFFNLYFPDIEEDLKSNRLVIQFGGLGSAKDSETGRQKVTEFLDLIETDASIYRDAMYERAKAIAQLENSDNVYWQIGNEISATSYSTNIHEWAGDGIPASDSDVTIIPIFVEYFLAPGVEGIERASEEVFGEKEKIHLMLGSVVNINDERKQDFIDAILDYKIQGTYAPTLHNKTVAEVINSISIHYSIGAPSSDWEDYLDHFVETRMGENKRIKNIFSTEEIGGSAASGGEAQGATARLLGRYMNWWEKHGWGPERGQLFLYAPDSNGKDDNDQIVENTSAGYFLTALSALIGDELLTNNKTHTQIFNASSNLEWYSFLTSHNKRLIVLFSEDKQPASVERVIFDYEGIEIPNITLFHLEKNSMSEYQPIANFEGDNRYEIDLSGYSLQSFDALVIVTGE